MTLKTCDNASVGVIISDPQGRFLLIERGTPPAGLAPVAGHVFDDHPSYIEAARAEVAEEIGGLMTDLELIGGGWRPNRCRRAPGERGIGHQWQIFRAALNGDALAPSAREVKAIRWMTGGEIAREAARTVAYANGNLSEADWIERPGIEPVWVRWLIDAEVIDGAWIFAGALAAIERRAAAPIPAQP